jgi:hypothetical protein
MVGGIGGGGGPTGPGKIGGPGAGAPVSPSSSTEKASFGETLGAKKVEGASGPSPLDRLRAGEIDRQGYVELRVKEATTHLEGVLSPADLEKVQEELRDVIENDPDLQALVKAAEVGS